MQIHISTNGTAKMAKHAGKMLKMRQSSDNDTPWLGITVTAAAITGIAAATTRFMTRYRRNPQQLLRPVITTLDKSERLLDKAASGLKDQVDDLDLSPQLKREVEEGIDQINDHLHQATQIAKQKARQLESASSSNGRTGDVQPFGHNAS